jgi:predicted permease
VDPGFDPGNRLVFTIALPAAGEPSREEAAAAIERTLQRLEGLPGVKSVGFTNQLPFTSGGGDPLAVRSRPDGLTKLEALVMFRRVSPSYFGTMNMGIRAGRPFDASDATGHTNAVVVDQALADIYFPGQDPIGQQVRPFAQTDGGWLTIVGVTNNTPATSLREKTRSPHMYLPTRTDSDADTPSLHRASFVLETQGDPLSIVPLVRSALKEVNPDVAMAQPDRLSDLVARADARTRFTMILLVIAASVALLLGIVGVYAVIAYAVSQRASEIGVRLALGAQPSQVSAMILRESGPVLVVGIGAGTVAAFAAARAMQAMLFGVAWNDARTYAAAAALLFLVGVAACWLPASRAARANPLEALR